jgi:hypothetical protein
LTGAMRVAKPAIKVQIMRYTVPAVHSNSPNCHHG